MMGRVTPWLGPRGRRSFLCEWCGLSGAGLNPPPSAGEGGERSEPEEGNATVPDTRPIMGETRMTATGIGAPVRRKEDQRFITGKGRYPGAGARSCVSGVVCLAQASTLPPLRGRVASGASIGAPVRRKEDQRFITGKGRYVDDINRPGQAHACARGRRCRWRSCVSLP
jgi:hypothetical protein